MIKQEQEIRNRLENLRAIRAQSAQRLKELEAKLIAEEVDTDYEELVSDIATARTKLEVLGQEIDRTEQALEEELARQQSSEHKAELKKLAELKKAADKKAQAVEKSYDALRAEMDELEAACKQHDSLRTKLYGVSAFSFQIDKYLWVAYLRKNIVKLSRKPDGMIGMKR